MLTNTMSPLLAVSLIIVLVLSTTAAGLIVRARSGRVTHRADGHRISSAALGTTAPLGRSATLVQFSTEFCAQCPGTRRLLHELADGEPGVGVLDVDLTHRPDLADRFSVLQTPTVLLLDRAGVVRGRFSGAARRAVLAGELQSVLRRPA
ncbi:Thioredoxin [Plantibacter sp. VKM Ac-1784]|uniref:Thioredoxin n=2 Tax=Plantibacter elymi (nom. nud.) TaxID=199708 RepID=A0ABY1RCD8_9MICO|nr:Thioredoxin [Plantibacter sp. VKM Ac-1784]